MMRETMWLYRWNGPGIPQTWVPVNPIWSHLSYPSRKPLGLIQVRDPERGEYPVKPEDLRLGKPKEKR